MTTQKPALEIKTKQLQITAKCTTNMLDKGDEESIERHLATLRTIISDVEKLRLDVEVEKLVAEEDTSEWECDVNGKARNGRRERTGNESVVKRQPKEARCVGPRREDTV